MYLYRAVDSTSATIDFFLSAKCDAAAAERFLTKALGGENHSAPRVINTDKHAAYPPAIVGLKADGVLAENCTHRPGAVSITMSWNRIIGRSSAASVQVSIFAPSGEPGARSPAAKRFT